MSGKRSKKGDKDRQHFLLSKQHLQRSSVRPFLCCGSQVSLNSIPELKDFPVDRDKVTQDDDYEDLTDSDDHGEDDQINLNTTFTVENISKIDQTFKRSVRLSTGRHKKSCPQNKSVTRKKFWTLKLRGKLHVSSKRSELSSDSDLSSARKETDVCVCTSYKPVSEKARSSENISDDARPGTSSTTVSFPVTAIAHIIPSSKGSGAQTVQTQIRGLLQEPSDQGLHRLQRTPTSSSSSAEGACGTSPSPSDVGRASGASNDRLVPFVKLNELYPISDIDEQRIAQRQREMERGIEVEHDEYDDWTKDAASNATDGLPGASGNAIVCASSAAKNVGPYPTYGAMGLLSSTQQESESPKPTIPPGWVCPSLGLGIEQFLGSSFSDICQLATPGIHTQVDYKHYLVPDIDKIVTSSFYWGVMDRYQAEKLIENKPEGTFLLRDSAQDEFLFSVSFRRYGRSLHARIEQWNHKFSFDSRDPGVFATDTVCGLIEHYLDPSCCMFFEPMLTRPLNRTFPFSLQHLSRAIICSRITYDGISKLTLPTTLKEYLRFYHYKQKVRVRRFDNVA